MFLYSGGYRKDVGVEDDVLGSISNLFSEYFVGTLTNGYFSVFRICLSVFKGHDDH